MDIYSSVEAETYADYGSGDAAAGVTIAAGGDIETNDDIYAYTDTGNATATLNVDAAGNIATYYYTYAYADTDTGNAAADVAITTDGDVAVEDDVKAEAYADGGAADAAVIITAGDDIIVNQETGAAGSIGSIAEGGNENSAETILMAASDVLVNNGESDDEVYAEARDGYTNTAFVGIATHDSTPELFAGETLVDRGEGDIVINGIVGAYAKEAFGDGSSNSAEVEISAARDVVVNGAKITQYVGEPSGYEVEQGPGIIEAIAGGGYETFADVDVFAGRDVIINVAEVTVELGSGGSDLDADLDYGGQIIAKASEAFAPTTNTANVLIVSEQDTILNGSSENPLLSGMVSAQLQNGPTNIAGVSLYAGGIFGGTGEVIADADPGNANIEVHLTSQTNNLFEGNAYANGERVGFDDTESVMESVAAPIAQTQTSMTGGKDCPQLVQAAAAELGITADAVEAGMGCESCAALVAAANILKDVDESRMAAMVRAFNTLAPADAPFTPATSASIATAFESAAGSDLYASAIEYVDAFVQYVAVLETEMGSPVGDSVAFVMDKYGAGVLGSDNANIASYVAMRLAAMGQ